MSRTRHILAAALLGLSFAAGACGDDEEDGSGQTNQEDSVVQDQGTPADEQGNTTPPGGGETDTRTTRTDGE